jgi:hypothetical protein
MSIFEFELFHATINQLVGSHLQRSSRDLARVVGDYPMHKTHLKIIWGVGRKYEADPRIESSLSLYWSTQYIITFNCIAREMGCAMIVV